MKKNVLVTGGAGYIGSHVCKLLSQRGYQPIVLDNLVAGYKEFVQWGPFIEADIADEKTMKAVVEKYQPIALMHFAAFTDVGESVRDPYKYYQNNVIKTISLLNALRPELVVFSSTAAVYGNTGQASISEDTPKNPLSPYGFGKLAVEHILGDFGARSVSLRYFNAAGADPDGDIGEAHVPETHLIPLVLDAASGRRKTISIFGTDYDTRDRTCVRDYIHVSDLADAHVRALDHLISGGKSVSLNLGNGTGFTVKEVIQIVEKITGKQVPIIETERRPGDSAILVADASRAKEILGWKPVYPDLETIVRDAWNWHQRRFF